jgi:hypothetical protein
MLTRLGITLALLLATLGAPPAIAARTDHTIEYHGGPVMAGNQDVYLVWYGCWMQPGCGGPDARYNDQATMDIVTEFTGRLGGTPYFAINTGYANSVGQTPSGAMFYAGSIVDRYSRGTTLTEADIAGLISKHIEVGDFPQDSFGVYVLLTSSDVAVVDGSAEFCVTCCNFHGTGVTLGVQFKYAFVGNPARCPNGCASQFEGAASPNANFAADAMAAWLAHALSGLITNPTNQGWYDRYGLENSEKCEGTFGPTQTMTNPDGQPAEFNVTWGPAHYLLQQNWVNSRKGHCALNSSQ